MLHKTRGYHKKFDFMKSIRVYYWYFKIPQREYTEHGLKIIKFYIQKRIAPQAICCNPL